MASDVVIETPEWVKHAVFYQIFPDRFARSPRTENPRGIRFKPWGSRPEIHDFQGGDLFGVVDHLDYLKGLGINAIYLNPIFSSASNHRYHTYDYYKVDPLLGGDPALRELIERAHALGIRVVLDGVFNHASRGFWQFHHILENGGNSPYIDWFTIEDWPLRPYPATPNDKLNYLAWVGLPALPKLNTNNPGVRDMIMDVGRYGIEEFGIDGWRLDVPYEIDDDSFWQEFRRAVKEADPQAYICGRGVEACAAVAPGRPVRRGNELYLRESGHGLLRRRSASPTSIPAVMIICLFTCPAVPRQHRRDARSLRLGDRPGPAQHARQP